MTSQASETVGDRLRGERPGRAKALLASVVAGTAVAVLTYRWLRGP